jgi:hypothetical protein
MKLITIVPRIPPAIDGVGDYALSIARLLRENLGVLSQFIVADLNWPVTERVEGFEARSLSSHSTDELVDLLNLLERESTEGARVLLHYEGYGYASRGCPAWLVNALERWRLASSKRSLVTLFHELYATGPPWTSSFWLSPLQKNLATRVAQASDQCLTSLARYARVVRQMSGKPANNVTSIPVFSSIGEPESTLPLVERPRRLVVFGTRGRRIEVYKKTAPELNRMCNVLGITDLLDIGRSVELDIPSLINVPITKLGELPGAEVSSVLSDSIVGVLDYSAAFLAKSTIFAAYCAHRVIPIVANYSDPAPGDGLEQGRHYWPTTIESKCLDLVGGQVVADNAFAWYQTHNLSSHARTLADCLIGREGSQSEALASHVHG